MRNFLAFTLVGTFSSPLPFTIAHDHTMQLNGLLNEICNHRPEAHVVIRCIPLGCAMADFAARQNRPLPPLRHHDQANSSEPNRQESARFGCSHTRGNIPCVGRSPPPTGSQPAEIRNPGNGPL